MGMGLFYVTVFGIFLWVGWGGWFCGFTAFFEGYFGKRGCLVWCFDGEFVVVCVVEMDWKQRTFWRLKMCHDFELYFWVAAGEGFRCPL
jgi:hypothetical protein